MSDPTVEEQVAEYVDEGMSNPPKRRYLSHREREDIEEMLDWMSDPEPTIEPAAERSERPCVMCGALLLVFGDSDAACRSCEQGW